MNTTISKNLLGAGFGGGTRCRRGPTPKSAIVLLTKWQWSRWDRVAGLLAVLLAAVFLNVPDLHAQGGTQGSIVGRVTDSTGAAITGATITVTEMDKQTTVSTVTTEQGDYTVPYVLPGRYMVSVRASGFTSQEVQNIVVDIAQVVRRDILLKPGSQSQSVTVSAGAFSLDTDSAEIGTVITGREIVDLPLNGRNFQGLMFLGPTVTTVGDDSGGTAISVGGARSSSNYYTIDGINDLALNTNNPLIFPSLDTIQEFKEQTKSYSAAYGSGATQITLSTKSGTNSIHGTAFEFLRNDALNAYGYVFPGNPVQPKAKERLNQFGYSAGFPIVIPHIYDGRNRTFFFANLEQLTSPGTTLLLGGPFPSPAQKQGLFTTPVYDPQTGQLFPKDPSGQYYQIPASRFSRMANASLTPPSGMPYFPDPNIPGAPANGVNYQTTVPTPSGSQQQTYRVDENIGTRDSLFGRFTLANTHSQGNGGVTAATQTNGTSTSYQYAIGETHIFSPNVVNNARFGWLYGNQDNTGLSMSSADASALGLANTYPLAGQAFPSITITGYQNGGGANNQPTHDGFRVWDMSDSLTVIRGAHAITIGAQLRLNRVFNQQVTNLAGEYSFDNFASCDPGVVCGISDSTTMDPFANFLLGRLGAGFQTISLPTSYSNPQQPFTLHMQDWQLSPYVNDDWKVTKKLTINAGLRYDFRTNPIEANNHIGWFDPTIPGGGLNVPDKKLMASGIGGSIYTQSSGPAGNSARKLTFAPRFGFAYRPDQENKWVLRAGYGIFFDQWDYSEIWQTAIYPYGYTPTVVPYTYTNNLWPAAAPGPITASALGFFFSPPTKYYRPYLQQYSLSVERDLGHGTKLEVAYTGSVGTHLEGRSQLNQPPVAASGPGTAFDRRPFTNFGSILIVGTFNFKSNYNAGYVSLQHQSRDLALRAAYTWSKSLDTRSDSVTQGFDNGAWAGPMDSYNPQLDYGRSSIDIGQVFIASGTYSFPFGRGKTFVPNVNRAVDAVIGGWQLNAITGYSQTPPINVWANDTNGALGTYGQRGNFDPANRTPGFKRSNAEWFDTAQYSQPAPGVFGNAQRDCLRGPNSFNIDSSIFKNFAITDRVAFQFRLEAFNATNHVNFQPPDGGVPDGTFGVITQAAGGRQVQLAGKIIF